MRIDNYANFLRSKNTSRRRVFAAEPIWQDPHKNIYISSDKNQNEALCDHISLVYLRS